MGTHGCGVSTPIAAAFAEATCGLLGDMHIPKGMTLILGLESSPAAATGLDAPLTVFAGRTTSFDGALLMEHERDAPSTTRFGMVLG
jgi:hypothetical protein